MASEGKKELNMDEEMKNPKMESLLNVPKMEGGPTGRSNFGPHRGRGGVGNRHRGRGGRNNGGKFGGNFDPEFNNSRQAIQQGRDQRNAEERKLAVVGGPTVDLPPIDQEEKKFSGRCRLYVGNLPNETTKEEIESLFSTFGEVSEVFTNSEKMFAFVRLDYRVNAEKARRGLDGFTFKNRQIKVRFAPHSASIKCKNLNIHVTNELLEWAFQVFGEVERAVVLADERGKSTGEGIVEFARKSSAQSALRRCTEGCYFMTDSPRPVIVEPYEAIDETEGYSEKSIHKKPAEYFKERNTGPRFAPTGSFEEEYGARWKALVDLYKNKEDALKKEMKLEEEKLEAQMEYVRYERVTEMLRKELQQREQVKVRQKEEWELRERAVEERRRANDELILRQTDELTARMQRQDEELRRRQEENAIAMHSTQFERFNNQQEDSGQGTLFERREQRPGGLTGPGNNLSGAQGQPMPLMEAMVNPNQRGHQGGPPRNQRWAPDRRNAPVGHENFGPKRRRF